MKPAHKNTNSSRRQTNYIQIRYINTIAVRNLYFIKFNNDSILKKEYNYPNNKEKIPLYLYI